MENGFEKFFENNSPAGRIDAELQKRLAPLKCPEHDEKAKFTIYQHHFKADFNCCEAFDDYLNKEAKKIVDRMVSENDDLQ